MGLRTFTLLGGLASVMLAQPKITYVVDAAAGVGVTALSAPDPRFDGVLEGFLQNPRSRMPSLDGVRPYLLIITNGSTGAVARIGVRHEISYAGRPPIVWMQTLIEPDLAPLLQPGASLLAFQGVQNGAAGAVVASPREMDHLASVLAGAQEVVVTLDAVIFGSGLIVGPDKNGAATRYEAEQRAARDMLAGLQRLKLGGDGRQTLQGYLSQLAGLAPRRSLPLPDTSRDDAFNYQSRQRDLARFLVTRGLDLDGCIAQLASADARMKDLHR